VSDVWLSAYEDQNAGNKRENAQDDDWNGERERRDNSVNDEKDRQHEHAKIFIDDHARSLAGRQSRVTPKSSQAMVCFTRRFGWLAFWAHPAALTNG
jgi:hypothetical protein